MRAPLIPASRQPATSSRRVLEPGERIAEVLFGLIMVLSFTGSLSVAEAGRDDVRLMLIGALGCNIAWGIIDGILYLMDCLSERGRDIRALRAARTISSTPSARSSGVRSAVSAKYRLGVAWVARAPSPASGIGSKSGSGC